MKLQKRFESRIRAQEFKTQEALRRLSHNMLRFNNLKVLLKLIAHYLVKILRLNFAAIYLYESQYDKYLLSSVWQPKEEIGLPQEFEASGQLVRQLYIKKFPIVTEELGFYAPAPSAGRAKELFGVLSGLRINTVIPSFLRNGLVGFVVLSDRKNKIPFSQEDLNLLMVLSNEAALAIENAQFHQKEMFALLEKSKREALADMAPGASHQFNNRLAAISSSVELLLFKLENLDISNQPDEKIKFVLEDAKSALEMIDKEVYKGKEITSAILKRAKAKMEFQEFNLPGLIDNAYKLVMISRSRSDIEKAKEVKFSMDSLITNPSIVASEALLQDAFYNLIDNSYDAIQEKMRLINENKLGQEGSFDGIIEVTLRQDGSNVEVIIRDDGIGLTRENLRKLFTPYFTTKATSNKGSGLGLCVIRDFIERHKGSISCDSEYGKGAVFTIKLPMKR
ncbi:MAG: HAMP domain-containing sensor histidine kinase [Candidatus Omnitrophota bacterium]